MLIDSHCHLDYEDFEEEGVLEILNRAKLAGVEKCMTICTEISKFNRITAIAHTSDDIYCTVGTHPHHAGDATEQSFTKSNIVDLTKDPKVLGIGETGLDYFYDYAPKDAQHSVFKTHIEAGLETDLPLVIHTRDAEKDTMDLLRRVGNGKSRGVLHCFTGTQWLADQGLDIGYYISFSGIITFKKAQELRDIVKTVPMDRILVETDSPYLAPMPYRGKRNEPSYVVQTAKVVAEIKGVSLEDIAAQTTNNFYALFNKAKKD